MSQTLTTRQGTTQTSVGERRAKRQSMSKLLARIPIWVLIGLLLVDAAILVQNE
jgi:hypothetical protein